MRGVYKTPDKNSVLNVTTGGEYLLPNLFINRNVGTREYYELMWHDGHNYNRLWYRYASIGETIPSEEFYNVYEMAISSALLDTQYPFLLTMCELEN